MVGVVGSEIAAFLLARFDEEPWPSDGRRSIVAEWGAFEDACEGTVEGFRAAAFLDAMRMLAADYADHEDFRQEWLAGRCDVDDAERGVGTLPGGRAAVA